MFSNFKQLKMYGYFHNNLFLECNMKSAFRKYFLYGGVFPCPYIAFKNIANVL
uniref:Uncharacterized protein n=1 Tax=Anguilla anguilla TaxID=7936 RepID=A0A0E9PKE1_ANGAN